MTYMIHLAEPQVGPKHSRAIMSMRQHNPVGADVCVAPKVEIFQSFVAWFADVATLQDRADRLDEAVQQYYYVGLRNFFQDLLLQYQMTAKDRKTIERAARDTDRKRAFKFKRDPLTVMKTFAKKRKDLKLYLQTAQGIIDTGIPVDREACEVVGGFRIVNTGGFNDKVMGVVRGVMADATAAMRAVGLESVIYGDVNVIGSLRGNRRSLAHYDTESDEVFVRANLRGREGPAVRTVIHEIAHRLANRMKNKQALQKLYDVLKEQDEEAVQRAIWDRAMWPQKGTVVDKKWKVAGVSVGGRPVGPRVELALLADPEPKGYQAYIGMHNYLLSTGALHGAFVTPYARTNASENFAEMVSFWALDELSDAQQDLLLKAISEGLGV
jgi:hypothetical protein